MKKLGKDKITIFIILLGVIILGIVFGIFFNLISSFIYFLDTFDHYWPMNEVSESLCWSIRYGYLFLMTSTESSES